MNFRNRIAFFVHEQFGCWDVHEPQVTTFAGSGRMLTGLQDCERIVDDECGIDCANSVKRFFVAAGFDEEVDRKADQLGGYMYLHRLEVTTKVLRARGQAKTVHKAPPQATHLCNQSTVPLCNHTHNCNLSVLLCVRVLTLSAC